MADEITGELTQDKIMSFLSTLDNDDTSLAVPDDDRILDPKDGSDKDLVLDDDKDDDDDEKDEKLEKISDKLDDEELVVSDAPNRKEILAKYPKIFKDFPSIERAIYREHEFSEIFPTIADAKEAVTAQQNLAKVETELLSGNIGDMLARIKNVNQVAFDKISNPFNLLTAIAKVDKDSYLNLLAHVMKNTLVSARDSGKKTDTGPESDGKQLQIAAALIHKFLFNDLEVTAPDSNIVEDKVDPKQEALNRREQEANARDLKTASDSIASIVKGRIENFVRDNIDPKDQMSPYVKDNAIKDVMKFIDEEMSNDSRFRTGINRLYTDARKDNYSENSKSTIRKALLSKAKTILPIAIRNIRSKALKDSSERSSDRTRYRDTSTPKDKDQKNNQNRSNKKPDGGSASGILEYLNS